MAQLVYIDETGATGTAGAKRQPRLILAAVLVDESKVQVLGDEMRRVAIAHLGSIPHNFEFHGHEIWQGAGHWGNASYGHRIAAYEDVISLLAKLELTVAHASIDKANLHAKYGGAADRNAYRLALQFLLEKIDAYKGFNRIVIADEAKQETINAKKMLKDMQSDGLGEVPGVKLTTFIDSLHFVRSHDSPGVQMADLVAYVLQRRLVLSDSHPEAVAAMARLHAVVSDRTSTWREPWP